MLDALDLVAIAKAHTARGGKPGDIAREEVRIAGLIGRSIGRAGQPGTSRRKRGLDRDALVGGLDLAVASELAHELRRRERFLEFLGAGVEMEDSRLALVVMESGLAAQFAQRLAAEQPEIDDLADVVPRAGRKAFAQEAQHPRPLPAIGAQPKKKRRVLLEQPFEDLEGSRRIGPRLRVAYRDLAAVCER